jgi:diguanylate cyclase (GGDEF)-like protein
MYTSMSILSSDTSVESADIAIVGDRSDDLNLFSSMLSERGYTVRMLTYSQSEIQTIHATKPDLILLEIENLAQAGYQFCTHLKSLEKMRDIPIIFISSFDTPANRAMAFNAGGSDYITQPFLESEILARIKNQLIVTRFNQTLHQQTQQLLVENAKLQREVQERQKALTVLQDSIQQLQHLVTLDELTGVANRRQFDRLLAQEWRRCCREKQCLSLILCDVDFFKAYNDTYGHVEGDFCLRTIAQTLAQTVRRAGDVVARYGGEEFAVILPNTNAQGAIDVASRIQQAIAQLQLPHLNSQISDRVTLSLGIVSQFPLPDVLPSVAIVRADRQLYAAKAKGRNCYCVEEE